MIDWVSGQHNELQIDLPPIYCPVLPAIHPATSAVDAQTRTWTKQFGLLDDRADRKKAARERAAVEVSALGCGLTLPLAPIEVVQLATDFTVYALLLDDLIAEATGRGDRLAHLASYIQRVSFTFLVPDAGLLDESSPYDAACIELAHRLHAIGSPHHAALFSDSVREWLGSMLWEETSAAEKSIPSVNTYLVRRIGCLGARVVTALISLGANPSARVDNMDTTIGRALSQAINVIHALDNDLGSFGKEMSEEFSAARNLILLLGHDRPLQQAVAETVCLRNRVMCLFEDLSAQALPTACPDLQAWLDHLAHSAPAVIEYQWLATSRYPQPDGLVVPKPAYTDRRPIFRETATQHLASLPAIRWWWDQLTISS
ncbi:terpene synthase family protein [Nocardia sp. NPDC004260]